ncbi:MAG: AAA family ATPase, partial [Proteobacteria bacterium]|nr:AAA family ATPase [Pseudomonadota bacterium]
GAAVGLAARMQELASPDTTYLTGATAGIVSGYFELEDLGGFRIKGVEGEVPVSRLVGPGAARTRFDVSRARGLTRFVGRDADMRTLEDALEQAGSGKGEVVGVVAEAGTGKSRLCFEFVEGCRAAGLRVFEGQAVAHGKNIPLLPILQVFRAYFGISERDDPRTARERIAGRMLLLDESFRDVLPIVFDFFGVPDPERPAPPGDPEVRQRQLFAVLHEMTQKGQEDAPSVWLIEDLHWIDAGSEAFLEQLVEAVAGTRSLLVVNFRPEYRAGWMQRSWYRQLPIAPLGPEAIRELLEDLLGGDPSTAGLADRIHERTRGNPFFTEEVVQNLIESGALEGARGAYRLVHAVEELAIPDSVHVLLASRVDRLPEREKRVLQTASVIGKTFPEPLLAAVADVADRELGDALGALKEAEFVHEESLYPVAEYAFKHPLTQEVALGSLLRERRRELHGRVARALEATSRDKLDEAAPLLAHHFEEAGEPWQAAVWHDRAATWVRKTDVREAARHWDRALELLEDVPWSEEAGRLGVDTRIGLLQVAWRTGLAAERCDAWFESGLELVERLGSTRLEILLRLPYAIYLAVGPGLDEEGRLLQSGKALEAARKMGSRELELTSLIVYASSLVELGRVREAREAMDPIAEDPPRDLFEGTAYWGFHVFGFLLGSHGCCLAWEGRLAEGRREVERALELCRGHENDESLAFGSMHACTIAVLEGDLQGALAHGRTGLEAIDRYGVEFYRAVLIRYGSLAEAYLAAGQWEQAIRGIEDAIEVSQGPRWILMPLLAAAECGGGNLDRARARIEEAAPDLMGSVIGYSKLVLARIGVRAGDTPERVEATLREAAAFYEEGGALARLPGVHEVRAELLRRDGDPAGAEAELREARRRYQEMGATGHVERLDRELAS